MRKRIIISVACLVVCSFSFSGCGKEQGKVEKQVDSSIDVTDDKEDAKSSDIRVIKGDYDGLNNDYQSVTFTIKNTTDKEIHTVSIDINFLDRDGNIISTTHPQESSRLKSGQSISINATVEKGENAYSAVVDGYSYYCGDDFVNGYVEESPEIILEQTTNKN